jgi:GT2 family glycosyltransferase
LSTIFSKVYIVILNYKKWQDVVECLKSVFHLNYKNFTAFVIDNDSQNDSLQHIQSWAKENDFLEQNQAAQTVFKEKKFFSFYTEKDLTGITFNLKSLPQLVFIQNEQNTGFAGGNNKVLKTLAGQDAYIWLLNPDMEVHANSLSELLNCANEQPFKSIIGSIIRFQADGHKLQSYGAGKINFDSATITITRKKEQIPNIDFINGGALFFHASHLNDIGFLPEEYFLFWEETEWCFLAKRKGYRLHVCLRSICYHKVSSTIGCGFKAYFYYTRNGLLFVNKFKKEKTRQAILFQTLSIGRWIVSGKFSRAKGIYAGIKAFINVKRHENK